MTFRKFHLKYAFVFMVSVALAQTSSAQDSITPNNVQQALGDSQNERALQMSLTGIESQPDEVAYYRLQAQALRALDRVNEIPAAISGAIESHPRDSDLILERAIAYKILGDGDKLIADVQTLIRLGEGRGFVLMAELAEAKGERLTAVRCYTRLIETFPEADDLADWQFARAQLFTQLHVLDWAFVDVTASQKAEPAALKVLLLGELHARAEQWEDAEEALQQFNKMTDKHYVGEVRRLNVLLDMNEIDKVAYLLEQYQEKYDGTDKLVHIAETKEGYASRIALNELLKKAASEQQRPHGFETAEEITAGQQRMKALADATDPVDRSELKELLIHHAQLGMVQSNTDYAEVMLKTLANLKPKFTLTQQDLAREATVSAWMQMQARDYQSAGVSAKKAILLDPKCADAHRVAASIYYMQDQNEQALVEADKAVQLDAMNSINVGYRGLIHTDLGNAAEANRDLNEGFRLDPNNAWIASLIARFAKSIGVTEAAIIYQGMPHDGVYNDDVLLERCELFLSAELPQLAVPDAMEYIDRKEGAGKADVSSIMARGVFKWYEQTLAFETGGPSLANVINACEKAEEHRPDDPMVVMLRSDVLRRDGQYAESLAAAKKTQSLGATYALLYQHMASLQLAMGDIAGAVKTNEAFQERQYDGAESAAIQTQTAAIVALAADLEKTLRQMKFTSETGKAMEQLLAAPDDTKQAFQADHAAKLNDFYASIRPETKGIKLKPGQTQLRIECVSTQELRGQDSLVFDFDDQLASIANVLQDGHFWFTLRCKNPETDSGPSFAYFVKLEDGWRIFPKPWAPVR